MNIANPYYLALLALCLVFLLLLFGRERRLKRRFAKYAELPLREHYYSSHSPFWTSFKLFLSILALGCIILALARPQWYY